MSGERDLFSEDFEVVSELSFHSPDSQNGGIVNGVDGDEASRRREELLPHSQQTVLDPYQTFELIHNEHLALKDELLAQQDLLKQQRTSVELQKQKYAEEITDLKNQVASLKIQLGDKEQRLTDLERQTKSFREASEKTDELAAKLYEAEDKVKYYEEVVRQYQSDGFVSVQPPTSTDAVFAKELKEKEESLEQLRLALVEKESTQIGLNEENMKLKDDMETMRNLIVALQAQLDNDQVEVQQMRSDYERRLNSLNHEVAQYLNDRQTGLAAARIPEESTITLLSHGETQIKQFECNRCKLRIPDENMYLTHVQRCTASLIENID